MIYHSIAIGLLAFLVTVQAWQIWGFQRKIKEIREELDACADHIITISLEDENGGGND